MSQHPEIQLDLNNQVFQRQLLALNKDQQRAVLGSLKKLSRMTWPQVYGDTSFRWEAILSRRGPHGGRLYSMRMGRGFRAVAYREENWLRFLTLHPDRDSAYSSEKNSGMSFLL